MRIITRLVFTSTLVLFSAGAFAQNAAEQGAMDAVEKYWEARNNQDFAVQADLSSEKGTLSANSDGSFFQSAPKISAEELEAVLAGTQATKVFYPEATELGKGVVMVRYYLEGVIESPEGTVPNYRTRVTTVMVDESGGWKIRAWHFSPLHDGGRHMTSKTDFEE